MKKKEKEALREKVKKITEEDIFRDALRARKFSGEETLQQAMDLINFALRIKKMRHENS